MSGERLPAVLLTGASGFIGRNLIEHAKRDYKIYALARRSRRQAHVPADPNVEWIVVDLADADQLATEIRAIRNSDHIDYILHLAGYYDFGNQEHPAYERSNVITTRNMLHEAESLDIDRFVFTSSMTVTEFPRPDGKPITESSPADATFPYARAKRRAEHLVREASIHFPCSTVRLAAIFSDWCEYGPLYMLLSRWFSKGWTSRIIGGEGKSAIPYLHVHCAVVVLLKILELSDQLKQFDTYLASPCEPVPQKDIYFLASRLYHGASRAPVYLPRPVAASGVAMRDFLGRLVGRRPQERLWMIRYIDKQMLVDPGYTEKALHLSMRDRLQLLRRLPYMVENAKFFPAEWQTRNQRKIKPPRHSINILASDVMRRRRHELVNRIHRHMRAPDNAWDFPHYQRMNSAQLQSFIEVLFDLVMASVRSGERMPVLNHTRYLATLRLREGFPFNELERALRTSGQILVDELAKEESLRKESQFLKDNILVTMQLAIDEAEDAFEEARVAAARIP